MAESWRELDENDKIIEGRMNELYLKHASAVCDSRDEAYKKALELDGEDGQWGEGTEYGVVFDKLIKDGGQVKIIE